MRILIASPIDAEAVVRLAEEHEVTCALGASERELARIVPGHEVLVFRSGVTLSRAVLEPATELRLLIRAGSGLDNVDLAAVERLGVPLLRIAEPGARAVAELALAHMLALARNLLQLDGLARQGHWAKHIFENHLLLGRTLGVVGVGQVGRCLGSLAAALGLRVVGCVKRPSPERAESLRREGIELADFDEVVARADFLSVHVPLDETTRGLVGATVLERMRPGSYLIHLSRGGVVDEAALFDALRSGERLRGAGLDAHEHEGPDLAAELRRLPNVVLTPHVGACTVETQRAIGREILAAVRALASQRDGRPPLAAAS
jgi:phosphoglycerate dehydrogenase-like enzyme